MSVPKIIKLAEARSGGRIKKENETCKPSTSGHSTLDGGEGEDQIYSLWNWESRNARDQRYIGQGNEEELSGTHPSQSREPRTNLLSHFLQLLGISSLLGNLAAIIRGRQPSARPMPNDNTYEGPSNVQRLSHQCGITSQPPPSEGCRSICRQLPDTEGHYPLHVDPTCNLCFNTSKAALRKEVDRRAREVNAPITN